MGEHELLVLEYGSHLRQLGLAIDSMAARALGCPTANMQDHSIAEAARTHYRGVCDLSLALVDALRIAGGSA